MSLIVQRGRHQTHLFHRNPTEYYDSVTGKLLFTAPKGRTVRLLRPKCSSSVVLLRNQGCVLCV